MHPTQATGLVFQEGDKTVRWEQPPAPPRLLHPGRIPGGGPAGPASLLEKFPYVPASGRGQPMDSTTGRSEGGGLP